MSCGRILFNAYAKPSYSIQSNSLTPLPLSTNYLIIKISITLYVIYVD